MRGKNRISFFLLIVFIGTTVTGFTQTRELPLSKPENREVVNYYEQQAIDYVSKNLNRFAYERLQRYDYYLDSLYIQEKKDTLAAIEKAYQVNSASKRAGINDLDRQITELTIQKEGLENRYWSLIRKAVISFILWLVIVLALLQIRKRKLSKAKSNLQAAETQLQSIEESAKNSDHLVESFSRLKEPIQKLNDDFSKLRNIFTEAEVEKAAEVQDISKKTDQLMQAINIENRIVDSVLSQSNSGNDDKIETDINKLCEQYFEIAYRGEQKPEEFNCQVTRDFEKKIPSIKINQAAVGSLLLNVLTNAFQSVKEQNKKGVKGYHPKVSISTRILPRFLQIRVKDNGTGMKEDILKKAPAEFFSTRPLKDGSGLGLYFANSIINEMHKGEIKIESEVGSSTDVYIKFFI